MMMLGLESALSLIFSLQRATCPRDSSNLCISHWCWFRSAPTSAVRHRHKRVLLWGRVSVWRAAGLVVAAECGGCMICWTTGPWLESHVETRTAGEPLTRQNQLAPHPSRGKDVQLPGFWLVGGNVQLLPVVVVVHPC